MPGRWSVVVSAFLVSGCAPLSPFPVPNEEPPPSATPSATPSAERLEGIPKRTQDGPRLVEHERIELSQLFFGEGASAGDFNKDGVMDVISGPYWYEGPDFLTAHEMYPPVPLDPVGYSEAFFQFVRDFDGDTWPDVLVVGFPGHATYWYENAQGAGTHWTAHLVAPEVGNESPTLADITGDGESELLMQAGGRFGWAAPATDPREPWSFHPISEDLGLSKFTHGLGIGDINGDGRSDLVDREGWWEQPASLAGDPAWTRHLQPFHVGGLGGAQMLVYDVDDDGDNDVVTSLDAHGWGLSWFEQARTDGEVTFTEHRIMDAPVEGSTAVAFSQLHALALFDMNADGAPDVVTGKRRWAHGPAKDPEPNAPPVLYWFELARDGAAPTFVPHQIDDASGVGTQIFAADINDDGLGDVVVGNKLGTFVFVSL
jgi:hypothetical protein